MKLTSRISTNNFIDIKVDEMETTIFETDTNEIDDTITNLLNVIEDLARLRGVSINVVFSDMG